MLLTPQVLGGQFIGLLQRRLKWHVAEHNRIRASESRLIQEGLASEVAIALASHKGAADEITAIMDSREPDWGGEQEVTEEYLYVEHGNGSVDEGSQ